MNKRSGKKKQQINENFTMMFNMNMKTCTRHRECGKDYNKSCFNHTELSSQGGKRSTADCPQAKSRERPAVSVPNRSVSTSYPHTG